MERLSLTIPANRTLGNSQTRQPHSPQNSNSRGSAFHFENFLRQMSAIDREVKVLWKNIPRGVLLIEAQERKTSELLGRFYQSLGGVEESLGLARPEEVPQEKGKKMEVEQYMNERGSEDPCVFAKYVADHLRECLEYADDYFPNENFTQALEALEKSWESRDSFPDILSTDVCAEYRAQLDLLELTQIEVTTEYQEMINNRRARIESLESDVKSLEMRFGQDIELEAFCFKYLWNIKEDVENLLVCELPSLDGGLHEELPKLWQGIRREVGKAGKQARAKLNVKGAREGFVCYVNEFEQLTGQAAEFLAGLDAEGGTFRSPLGTSALCVAVINDQPGKVFPALSYKEENKRLSERLAQLSESFFSKETELKSILGSLSLEPRKL